MKKQLPLLLILLSALSANSAVIIDTFSSGAETVVASASHLDQGILSGCIGTARNTLTANGSASLRHGGSSQVDFSSSTQFGSLTLSYGTSIPGGTLSPLNASFSSNDTLRINFKTAPLAANGLYSFEWQSPGSQTATATGTLSANSNQLDIALNTLTQTSSFSFDNVTGMSYQFAQSDLTNLSFSLDSMEVVPEPATLGLITVVGIGVITIRRIFIL